ncbi:MAG: ComF family protein [Acidimicrobiia bacterium]
MKTEDLSFPFHTVAAMVCLVCHRLAPTRLCPECRRGLRPAPEGLLAGGVRLVAGFEHTGPAKTLVHHFKYRGIAGYADLVAALLVPRMPPAPLVPVPRALTRRIRYGIDPGRVLARRISRLTGSPVAPVLRSPLHGRRRAGGDHGRPVAPFRIGGPMPPAVVLVDDVVTTGATLEAAIAALGPDRVLMAIAANAVTGARR